jgi:hypothetical protein
MKERPILMSGLMVRAILEGRKTQTRRVVKPQPEYIQPDGTIKPLAAVSEANQMIARGRLAARCKYGTVGDRLWVRETWSYHEPHDDCSGKVYAADQVSISEEMRPQMRWRPSIFMPRWMSRITLEITDVRVERVQDISEADARAEGMRAKTGRREQTPQEAFAELWNEINAARGFGWESNPWVWVVSFKAVERTR